MSGASPATKRKLSFLPRKQSFCACAFFFLTLRRYFGKWVWLFIFWAATICYGQIYVGVHYPTDIIGGAY
ncbi:phosphatase PAP2 family protein [Arachidicoccus ginsenosidivorans]|uniref:Phosphatase PAP2 family protein n=1 Tax=Arachidicoccus ginsenosidivorans TaxID=496057 RepID=A0A5B8VVT6_9BACT|nr:phosphatase PAP2 family protein [Arachidicoccus ginsenosidivorans]